MKKQGFATNRSGKNGAVISITNADIRRIKDAYDKKLQEYKLIPLEELKSIYKLDKHNNKKLSQTYRDALIESIYPKIQEDYNKLDLSVLEEKYVSIDPKEKDKIRQIENQCTYGAILSIKEKEYDSIPLEDIRSIEIKHDNVMLRNLYEKIRYSVSISKIKEELEYHTNFKVEDSKVAN